MELRHHRPGGVAAEAELLAAITLFFQRVGITPGDVGIKVNSRKSLQAVLTQAGVPENSFAAVCVVVDKIGKLPREKVRHALHVITGHTMLQCALHSEIL